jgi:bacillithiol synthase
MTTSTKRVLTEELGGSPLSIAAQSGRLPPTVFAAWPSDREEWAAQVQRTRRADAKWLDGLSDAIDAHGAAAQRLQRVVDGNGVVVTTGQQAGLFGGPLYTIVKAISAITLADELQTLSGVPVAPVFWAATDDADFLEASRTWVADADGLTELALPASPPAGTPMSGAPLPAMEPLLAALRKASGSAAHGQYLDAARSAYTLGRTVGTAYVLLLRELLEPLGISVLDSSHPAYLAAARPVLEDAARKSRETTAAVAKRTAEIRALGFEPQVDDERGLSLVNVVEKGVKRRLQVDEAQKLKATNTGALGANVLLRPVVERALLPTAAYVAGPAELAYFAQAAAVADALGRDTPIGVPRWSCTVIEPFAARALDRLGVDYRETRDQRALERRFASDSLPAGVQKAWKTLQETVRRSIAGVDAAVRDSALMPPQVIEGFGRSIEHRLERAERRLLAAAKRKDALRQHDIAVACAALFPMGKRQERVLNFIPILTRGGPELIGEMMTAARAHVRALVDRHATAATSR